MIGGGRVAERGTDAAEPLPVEVLHPGRRVRLEPGAAGLQVHVLRAGLGQAIGERLHGDRAVVVAGILVAAGQVLRAVDADGKGAEMVAGRGDVVGQAAVRPRVAARCLLPQHGEAWPAVDGDIVAVRVRGPESVDPARLQQAAGDDLVEQGDPVVEQLAGRGLFQDGRVLAPQLPGSEEKLPVDQLAELPQVGRYHAGSGERGHGQVVKADLLAVRPGLPQRHQRPALLVRVLPAQPFLLAAVALVEVGGAARVEQIGNHADDA